MTCSTLQVPDRQARPAARGIGALPGLVTRGWLRLDFKPVRHALSTLSTKWMFSFSQTLLNSLTGEALVASCELLKPLGRLVALGSSVGGAPCEVFEAREAESYVPPACPVLSCSQPS